MHVRSQRFNFAALDMTEYTFTLQGHVDSWGEGTIELVTDGLLEKGEHLRKEL